MKNIQVEHIIPTVCLNVFMGEDVKGMNFYELMEKELKSLDKDAFIMDVPQSKTPTMESVENMNRRLSIMISENENIAVRSFEKASRFALG